MDDDSVENVHNTDPSVRAVEDSGRSGVTPGFMQGSDWVDGAAYRLNGEYYDGNGKKIKQKKSSRNSRRGLLDAEKNASERDNLNQPTDSISGYRRNESKARGLYSGKGKIGKKKKDEKGERKGFLKKGAPIGLIVSSMVGLIAVMSAMQLTQPFSLIAQFQETFNSMHVSANLRTRTLFGYQMDNNRVKDPVRGTIFGRTFKVTDKQQEKLKKYGVEYDNDFDGKRVFKYDDGSDEIKIITADKRTANDLGDISGVDPSTGKRYSTKAFVFDDIYADNIDFHHAYNMGSLTWRGQIANWFGTRVSAFLINNNLTRNLFNDYENKKAAANGDGLEVVKESLSEKTNTIDNGGEKVSEVEPETNDDGEVTGYKEKESPTNSGKMTRGKIDDLRTKLSNIESKFSASANAVCGISNAVGAITLMVTAAEALQVINLATSYFEAVDKVKAGDGSDSPINDLANTLNEKKVSDSEVIKSISVEGDGNSKDDYSATFETSNAKKSAVESEGVAALYSGRKVNTNDVSVRSFNLTSSINNIMGGINSSVAVFQTCTIAKLATSAFEAANALFDAIGCIIGIVTAETGVGAAVAIEQCGELLVDIAAQIGRTVVVSVAIAGVIQAITPVLQSAWTRDLVSNIGGEDLGNALTSGGNMYLGGAHRANGGSPASLDEYKRYAVWQQQVIADNAKFERESLSPFDPTSKNTFMGALTTRLFGFASASSLTSVISSGSSIVSSSIASLSPTASAYDIAKTLPDSEEEYENTCPYLASIGMIGDAYCNPYVITDTSTIEYDPVDVIDKVDDYHGLSEDTTSDGNVKIAGDSGLAKYIRYCDNRSSMFGTADYNIASDINSGTSANTGNTYVDAAVDGAIGSIPIVGDGIDVVENANALKNIGYISGESCMAGNHIENNPLAVDSPKWEEAKYYQRFIEDQSLAESMGLIEKSAVTAYLEEYYEENPLDNSYEGMIARYSGLDKETVTNIIAIAEYYKYVKNYDPSERYAFGGSVIEKTEEIRFDNDNNIANNIWVVLVDPISYSDVRNRSFAV